MISENNTLVIRADAGGTLGTGHVMRMIALAQAWARRGGKVCFAACCCPIAIEERLSESGMTLHRLSGKPGSGEDLAETQALVCRLGASVVVLDGYHFDADYQRKMKASCHRTMVVDDFKHLPCYEAHLLLNQNLGADSLGLEQVSCGSHLMLGTSFALLREEYEPWLGKTRKIEEKCTKILVTMGGTDPNNATVKVLRGLAELSGEELDVRVLLGGGNSFRNEIEKVIMETKLRVELVVNARGMPEQLLWADLAVAAGGSTAWEMAFMGLPFLVITLAENQAGIAKGLEQAGAAIALGWHEDLNPDQIRSAVCELLRNPDRRTGMSEAGQALVDGYGARRVAAALDTYFHITFATAPNTWMNAHLEPVLNELRRNGHTIEHVHFAENISQSDITFLLSFEDLVKPDVLARSCHNLVVHASALPEGRGWSPLTWKILEGRTIIPVTLFEAEQAVDSGVIYGSGQIVLAGHELIDEVRAPMAVEIIRLCLDFIERYPMVAAKGRPQSGKASYYSRRKQEDSRLDLDVPLRKQINLLRVVDNEKYPAFFDFEGYRFTLKIHKNQLP
jgi:UDP-2,4-diacetamido-2,4,6-trideoxy-beta-L-altropyranose hydrolase